MSWQRIVFKVFHSHYAASAILLLAIVGLAFLSAYAFSFLRMLLSFVVPGKSLKKFGAKKGAWAVITGATAGIGRDFALQLASHGFNIFIASRTESKLQEIESEIKAKYPATLVRRHKIDFGSASAQDYKYLADHLAQIEVGVLINNVGKSYDYPMFFQELPDADAAQIVEINVNATLKVTKLVLPGMIERKRGLILTVGSFASLIPTPLLAVYAGSKAFVQSWSQALGSELKGSGVVVEVTCTSFVATKLSGIKKTSWMVPSPEDYVKTVLAHIGQQGGAVGQPHVSSPYHGHGIVQWVIDHFLSYSFWLNYNRNLHVDIRRRALRKKEREATAKKDK